MFQHIILSNLYNRASASTITSNLNCGELILAAMEKSVDLFVAYIPVLFEYLLHYELGIWKNKNITLEIF